MKAMTKFALEMAGLSLGGSGSDEMHGGFGLNTFEAADDGEIDQLLKSDQHAYNWIYDKAGNSPNGQKADKIGELDEFGEIFIQGVETEELGFQDVMHRSNLGETLDGIGIYASGTLEAVYVGNDLSISQLESMTQGIVVIRVESLANIVGGICPEGSILDGLDDWPKSTTRKQWFRISRQLIQQTIAEMDLDPVALAEVEEAFIGAGLL